jgi:hypothetical protein
MPTLSLTNCEILIGGTDMSSYLNKTTLRANVAELDVTTFGQTYRNRIGGLRDTRATWDGFWTSVPDAAQFPQLGSAGQAVTISPQGAEGSIAYLFLGDQFTYDQFGKVGDAAPFSATVAGNDGVTGLVRGQLGAFNRTVSATGQLGSILTMTAVGATQFLYATLHVLTAATTITIQVQSAPASNFAAPVTRATIGPLTTTGGTFMTRVAGPITDTFWRFNVSAITGTFVISGAIAQQ